MVRYHEYEDALGLLSRIQSSVDTLKEILETHGIHGCLKVSGSRLESINGIYRTPESRNGTASDAYAHHRVTTYYNEHGCCIRRQVDVPRFQWKVMFPGFPGPADLFAVGHSQGSDIKWTFFADCGPDTKITIENM